MLVTTTAGVVGLSLNFMILMGTQTLTAVTTDVAGCCYVKSIVLQ
jgi:hypothetical protein